MCMYYILSSFLFTHIHMYIQTGSTPLHYAVNRGYSEIVHLLLEYKANPYIKDEVIISLKFYMSTVSIFC